MVFADLEADDYSVGAIDLPACSVGASHKRNRLWFVADDHGAGFGSVGRRGVHREREAGAQSDDGGEVDELGNPTGRGLDARRVGSPSTEAVEPRERQFRVDDASDMGDAPIAGSQGRAAEGAAGSTGEGRAVERAGATRGFWSPADWLACTDGKARAVEPGTFPLADGSAARVLRLRGYGDGIVAPLAAEVIGAYLDLER